ncbi:hypothetical protein PENDEC_c003G01321 [Penicillium decumbens]|uniref:Uncharacterized protein n=1 Tax=Penicillium decumbens TaxID=69771 RepID=A0A1V6PJ85_PENDC|nr:hypothetical protein PENDEC_c003G01321 [Penicillium decumbens]
MAEGSTDLKPSSSWVAEMHQSPGKTLLIYFGFVCIWTVGSLVTSWTTFWREDIKAKKDPQLDSMASDQSHTRQMLTAVTGTVPLPRSNGRTKKSGSLPPTGAPATPKSGDRH